MDFTTMPTWELAALVILVGLVVVFAVLIILTFVIKIYGGAIYSMNSKKSAPPEAPKPPAAPPKAVAAAPVAPKAMVVEDGVSGEVVAAIAAAVDYLYGESAPAIRQIKRDRSAPSAWHMAGLVDNTRPF